MSVADKIGLGPQRTSVQGDDGMWTVTVTPPPWTSFGASTLQLTPKQHDGYLLWQIGGGMIQDLLPDLSVAQREILMTGIDETQWNDTFGEDQ